jgi:hypothetical protein
VKLTAAVLFNLVMAQTPQQIAVQAEAVVGIVIHPKHFGQAEAVDLVLLSCAIQTHEQLLSVQV